MTETPQWHCSFLATSEAMLSILEHIADQDVFELQIKPFRDAPQPRDAPTKPPRRVHRRKSGGHGTIEHKASEIAFRVIEANHPRPTRAKEITQALRRAGMSMNPGALRSLVATRRAVQPERGLYQLPTARMHKPLPPLLPDLERQDGSAEVNGRIKQLIMAAVANGPTTGTTFRQALTANNIGHSNLNRELKQLIVRGLVKRLDDGTYTRGDDSGTQENQST